MNVIFNERENRTKNDDNESYHVHMIYGGFNYQGVDSFDKMLDCANINGDDFSKTMMNHVFFSLGIFAQKYSNAFYL